MKEISAHAKPDVTIAVINHQLRGYPADCLKSLGAAEPPADTEFLLVQGDGAQGAPGVARRFPHVRTVRLARGDRATAKNLAVAEARGRFVLLATADTAADPETPGLLRRFIESRSGPTIASAQLLNENGMRRRTAYRFPSLWREVNLFARLLSLRHRVWRKGRPPSGGRPVRASALHATFLMADRELFSNVGEFTEGYHFAHEDIEWCWRAAKRGVGRYVLPDAHAFKLAPQLYGELPVAVRLGMEQSLHRLVAATRGPVYSALFRWLRKAKALGAWVLAGFVNRILPGHSIVLAAEAGAGRAVWKLRPQGGEYSGLPPDVESHVRWEHVV